MKHFYRLNKINLSEVTIDFINPSTWPSDCSKIRRHRLAVSGYTLYYFLRSVAEWGEARGLWEFVEAGSDEARTIVICSISPETDSPMVGVRYVKALEKWSKVSVDLYNYFVKEMGPAMEMFNLESLGSGKRFYYRPSNRELVFELPFKSHYYKVDKHLLIPQNLTATGDVEEVKHKLSTFIVPVYRRLYSVLSSVDNQIKTLTKSPHKEGGLINNDKVKNEILAEVLSEFFDFSKKEEG